MQNKNEKDQNDLEELKILKKEYIEISKQVYRDLEFFYERENISKRRTILNRTITLEQNKNYGIICKTLCEIVKETCEKKYGLNIEIITCDTDEFGHRDILLTTKNNNRYIINCLSDLERVQMGMKTKRFASKEYYDERYSTLQKDISFLSDVENRKIDEEIGYFQLMYMDDFFKELRKEFSELKNNLIQDEILRTVLLGKEFNKEKVSQISESQLTNLKVEFLLNFCNNRKNLIGHIELIRIYKMLYKLLFTEEERKEIQGYDCFFDKDEKNPPKEEIWSTNQSRVRFLKIKVEDNIYLLTTVNNKYVKMSSNQYSEFLKKYKAYEKPISQVAGLVTEAIRNKGKGVNLIKHIVVRQELNKIDKKISELPQAESKKIIDKIEKSDSDEIKFSIDEEEYEIKVTETNVQITINGVQTEYQYEGENLVENTKDEKITYYWKDEGEYEIKKENKIVEGVEYV